MTQPITSWQSMGSRAHMLHTVSAAMQNVARGISQMTMTPIDTTDADSRFLCFGDMTDLAGDPEAPMVGIYLLMEGELSGHALLTMPLESALNMADLLMGDPPGTATDLGELERSALAESGNLIVSYFLNSISSLTGEDMRPSPPAVMVDMLGAIMGVVLAEVAVASDDILVIGTDLCDPDGLVQARFWVLPDVVLPQIDNRQPTHML